MKWYSASFQNKKRVVLNSVVAVTLLVSAFVGLSNTQANNDPCGNEGLVVASATASKQLPGKDAYKAFDRNLGTNWNSGDFAPQWVQADLGSNFEITGVCLKTEMYPDGYAKHNISVSQEGEFFSQAGQLAGNLTTHSWSYVPVTARPGQFLRVTTTQSPSWIAWVEIRIYGRPTTPVDWNTGGGDNEEVEISTCPSGARLTVAPTNLIVNGSNANVRLPAGWSGGSIHTTNAQVARVENGFSVKPVSAGTVQVYGSGMTASNGAWPCTTEPTTVTVASAVTPIVFEAMTPRYSVVDGCMAGSSVSIRATSPKEAVVRVSNVVRTSGEAGTVFYTVGEQVASVSQSISGGFTGSFVVPVSKIGANRSQVQFKMYDKMTGAVLMGNEYSAVSRNDSCATTTASATLSVNPNPIQVCFGNMGAGLLQASSTVPARVEVGGNTVFTLGANESKSATISVLVGDYKTVRVIESSTGRDLKRLNVYATRSTDYGCDMW